MTPRESCDVFMLITEIMAICGGKSGRDAKLIRRKGVCVSFCSKVGDVREYLRETMVGRSCGPELFGFGRFS